MVAQQSGRGCWAGQSSIAPGSLPAGQPVEGLCPEQGRTWLDNLAEPAQQARPVQLLEYYCQGALSGAQLEAKADSQASFKQIANMRSSPRPFGLPFCGSSIAAHALNQHSAAASLLVEPAVHQQQ